MMVSRNKTFERIIPAAICRRYQDCTENNEPYYCRRRQYPFTSDSHRLKHRFNYLHFKYFNQIYDYLNCHRKMELKDKRVFFHIVILSINLYAN